MYIKLEDRLEYLQITVGYDKGRKTGFSIFCTHVPLVYQYIRQIFLRKLWYYIKGKCKWVDYLI